jgi:YfiH family protein
MIKGSASAVPRGKRHRSPIGPRPDDNCGCGARRRDTMTLPVPRAGFRWTRESWGDALRADALGAIAQHVFTSKQLALPDPESWRAVLSGLSTPLDRLMRVRQVHGNVVRVLTRGAVPPDASQQRPDGDAIVSNEPGLALAVMVADCNPILVVDPKRGAAAAIHAGWRGTCARVGPAAIEAMRAEFGSNPSDLVAAIGPSVGPDDYEVGESLIEAFLEAGHPRADVERWFIRTATKPRLDLWSANRDQLRSAGLDDRRIQLCGLSTVSHADVFDSYRVAGERAGRMAGIILVPAR